MAVCVRGRRLSQCTHRPKEITMSRRILGALCVAVGLAAAPALATNLPPGGTLNPCPGALTPTGTTEATGSVNFALHYASGFPNFQVFDTTGHVTYRVVRLADNTLTFVYYVTDDSTSDTTIPVFSVRDFTDFTCDVAFSTTFPALGDPPDRAERAIDGSSIKFSYDIGFISTCRGVWIKTNATSFNMSGHATISEFPNGNGSSTIGGLPRPIKDGTPPVAVITTPGAFADSCNPV